MMYSPSRQSRSWNSLLPLTTGEKDNRSSLYRTISQRLRSSPRLRLVLFLGVLCVVGVTFLPLGPPPPHHPHGRPYPPHRPGPANIDEDDWAEEEYVHVLPKGSTPQPDAEDKLWAARAKEVKAEFLDAYHAYEKHAMPRDELRPISKHAIDNFNGYGVSVVDSIDTMLIMGCLEEYERALKHVASINLETAVAPLPFFETTIRYLGGFLSAYALTKEPIFLSKADELGQRLLPVFNTSSGIPVFSVDASTGEGVPRGGRDTLLAEIGTFQLEFLQLARWTGRREYFEKADNMTRLLQATQSLSTGMWGTVWDTATGQQKNDKLAVGGEADSAYEYIIKSYLLGAKADTRSRDMFIRLVNGIIDNLVYISPNRHLLYVTDIGSASVGTASGKLEHLSCFLPGMIALGAKYLEEESTFSPEMKRTWNWVAEGLATTCWVTYADQASGLGPDEVMFAHWSGDAKRGLWMDHVQKWMANGRPGGVPPGVRGAKPLRGSKQGERDYSIRLDTYQLRPETVESLFVLYRTTGDSVWRDRAWEIFEAIRKHCKVEGGGYSSVTGLDRNTPFNSDAMPSWFLAETLKYLYLVASPKTVLPLDEYVFNTEAHPLPIGRWRDWEKERYGLAA